MKDYITAFMDELEKIALAPSEDGRAPITWPGVKAGLKGALVAGAGMGLGVGAGHLIADHALPRLFPHMGPVMRDTVRFGAAGAGALGALALKAATERYLRQVQEADTNYQRKRDEEVQDEEFIQGTPGGPR